MKTLGLAMAVLLCLGLANGGDASSRGGKKASAKSSATRSKSANSASAEEGDSGVTYRFAAVGKPEDMATYTLNEIYAAKTIDDVKKLAGNKLIGECRAATTVSSPNKGRIIVRLAGFYWADSRGEKYLAADIGPRDENTIDVRFIFDKQVAFIGGEIDAADSSTVRIGQDVQFNCVVDEVTILPERGGKRLYLKLRTVSQGASR